MNAADDINPDYGRSHAIAQIWTFSKPWNRLTTLSAARTKSAHSRGTVRVTLRNRPSPGAVRTLLPLCAFAFGAELTEEASVVGPHELLDEPSAVIEPEHAHEVPDDPCSVRLELPRG